MSGGVPTPTPAPQGGVPPFDPLVHVAQARAMFWQNCVRDMLTSLSIELSRQRAAASKMAASGGAPDGMQETPTEIALDGRMAVVTARGERIPIAEVHPVFACSVGSNARERSLSADVQCTIFQVRTPAGEVYTLPLSEIVGIHALTPELMHQLEEANRRQTGEGRSGERPFGFAALTSLARADAGGLPAPEHPGGA